MKPGQRPEAIDARLALRVYAWVTITGGLLVSSWPAALLPHAGFPDATPEAPWALTRVAVALVVAAGSCAAGLAALTDPLGRHRALHTFALAHLVFGVLFLMQWVAILELMLPPVVGWGPLLAGVALMYAATTGSSAAPIRRLLALAGSGDTGAPRGVLVDVIRSDHRTKGYGVGQHDRPRGGVERFVHADQRSRARNDRTVLGSLLVGLPGGTAAW